MGHPVTTNPVIIMLINMTVVFIVLIVLMYVIKLIHYVDPTAKKEEKVTKKEIAAAPKAAPLPEPAPEKVGIPEETIAVIAAAIASMGETGIVRAVRPIERNGWKETGRMQGIRRG